MHRWLANYSFLTSKTAMQKPNVYAGLGGADLAGFSNAREKPHSEH